jgi:uncharacterized membrane protein YgcG
MPTVRPLLLIVATSALWACAPARFIKSDAAFIESPRSAPPELFVEVAPQRPWRVVGTVELTLSGNVSEGEVISRAKVLGQQAGCELLTHGIKPPQATARWPRILLASLRIAHDHGDHAPPPPPERESAAVKESVSSGPTSSGDSSASSSGGSEGPASSGGGGGRVRRWRFDCGVYAGEVSQRLQGFSK